MQTGESNFKRFRPPPLTQDRTVSSNRPWLSVKLHLRDGRTDGRTKRRSSSVRPSLRWSLTLSMQTGPINSGVTKNSGAPAQISKYSPPSPAKGTWSPPYSTPSLHVLIFVTLSLAPFSPLHPHPAPVNGASRLAYFNIWRGGPPGCRTNRPTWQMPDRQAVQSAPALLVKTHSDFH